MVHPSVCPPFFIALYEQAFMVFYGSASVHDRMVYEKFHAKKHRPRLGLERHRFAFSSC